MSLLLQTSLLLNVALLMPVMLAIERNAAWARRLYGKRSPSRDILLAVYGGIFLLSAAALLLQDVETARSLLLFQGSQDEY